MSQAALRDVEALVEQLSGVCLHALRSGGPGAEEEEEEEEGGSPSLMQHIQVAAGLRRPVGYGRRMTLDTLHRGLGSTERSIGLESKRFARSGFQVTFRFNDIQSGIGYLSIIRC